MHTMQRLTRAYENAHLVEFDAGSKFVFMSDAHRGDGSISDEFTKNRHIFIAALGHYFDEGFTLIEAGDNEDLWEWPKFRHIAKANPLTYDLLKCFHGDDRYLRLYGNHDFQMADPDYVEHSTMRARDHLTGEWEAFLPAMQVHEAIIFQHRETGQEIVCVHGHQGDFWNDQAWKYSMFTFRIFWRYLHKLGIKSPTSPTANSFQRHKVERNYVRWIRRNGKALICGHTHRERFPRGDDAPYFNTGSCVYPNYITALELENDAFTLVTWRVVPDANGYLHVSKRNLAGPTPIEEFDLRPDPARHRRPSRSLDWQAKSRRRVRS